MPRRDIVQTVVKESYKGNMLLFYTCYIVTMILNLFTQFAVQITHLKRELKRLRVKS